MVVCRSVFGRQHTGIVVQSLSLALFLLAQEGVCEHLVLRYRESCVFRRRFLPQLLEAALFSEPACSGGNERPSRPSVPASCGSRERTSQAGGARSHNLWALWRLEHSGRLAIGQP